MGTPVSSRMWKRADSAFARSVFRWSDGRGAMADLADWWELRFLIWLTNTSHPGVMAPASQSSLLICHLRIRASLTAQGLRSSVRGSEVYLQTLLEIFLRALFFPLKGSGEE